MQVMRALWLKYLKGLSLFLVLSAFLTILVFWITDYVNHMFGGQAPYSIRFVIVLISVVVIVLLLKITIDKPYRELQEARKRAKESK